MFTKRSVIFRSFPKIFESTVKMRQTIIFCFSCSPFQNVEGNTHNLLADPAPSLQGLITCTPVQQAAKNCRDVRGRGGKGLHPPTPTPLASDKFRPWLYNKIDRLSYLQDFRWRNEDFCRVFKRSTSVQGDALMAITFIAAAHKHKQTITSCLRVIGPDQSTFITELSAFKSNDCTRH